MAPPPEQPKDWDALERMVEARARLPEPLLCPQCSSPVEVQYALNRLRPAASVHCRGCRIKTIVCVLPLAPTR
ncbi:MULTISPECIES: hypothetical protein [unclassified Corallococcus]|uniref:hypothetical protein n=1 Tax=unclassified Corallococcus TaxID=2685029 RepID=UPI001A9062EE|nr:MULTISPECIES: hypothetical protein [unclassified Corallococcus]MBN9687133.1 hypothetical protein [Corallococcus sp. NCSPR001]WAS89040.1 hypothetical protein O0N60_19155 [Corallococcus sp. NCRR]